MRGLSRVSTSSDKRWGEKACLALVLQARNAGVRRRGNEAKSEVVIGPAGSRVMG